jgi:hypothetical protein
LLIDVHFLSEFSKVALNSFTNASSSFNNGDYHSNKGANNAKVVFDNNMPIRQPKLGHLDNDVDATK